MRKMNKASAIGFALMAASAVAWFAFAGDDHGLCVNGHPAPRKVGITYGGLPVIKGYVRDHYPAPLCLGQQDTESHVRYQPPGEAEDKDRLERYACEAYCKGKMDLTHARNLFNDWPQSYSQIFGEWPPHAEPGAKDR
jgi:hypothetical protein